MNVLDTGDAAQLHGSYQFIRKDLERPQGASLTSGHSAK
jgi:hypothetical protein